MYDELRDLYNSDIYPMHMPGHKRREGFGQITEAVSTDITEIDGYDDLYEPDGIIKDSLDMAAKLYGADHTLFLVNGSTVGILSAVFAVTKQHGNLLMARNCHRSVYHAASLRELETDYIYPKQTDGMYDAIDPGELREKLEKNRYDAFVITSPTYEGRISDIEKIAGICHDHNTVLIVDSAHGAHFSFHERFPKSMVGDADIVIMSTHKTLPALTQTGLLHVKDSYYGSVHEYLQKFQTSSPSYLLMSSIDSCLRTIKDNGSRLWDDFFLCRDAFADRMKQLKFLRYIETDDPCKIVISTKYSNIYATELAKRLLDDHHIQVEMACANYIVAIVTCNDTAAGFERFSDALTDIDRSLHNSTKTGDAIGRYNGLLNSMAKDNIFIYPPGIPIAAKGEIIDENMIQTLNEYDAAGLKIRGL